MASLPTKGIIIAVYLFFFSVLGLSFYSLIISPNEKHIPTTREEKIKASYDQMNGQHLKVTDSIKKLVEYPSSFNYLRTETIDLGDSLEVKVKFSCLGNNDQQAYHWVTAIVKPSGDIINLKIN